MENKLFENLIKILHYEYRIYSSILEIAIKKTESLIHNNLDEITAITSKENELAGQAQQLNDAREKIIANICASLGKDDNTIKISELKEMIPEPYKGQLENISKKLSECINKLQERNGINQKLIETAINCIDFSMQLLASPQPETPGYGKTGNEVSGAAKRSVLDIKY
ncbi:MAG: flagellar protein FlgN [Clostridiaceae bacterium]|mgnify:CR=1 FL=1|nr:flagellar protein FlgN [Clostridiaceae bacterium]